MSELYPGTQTIKKITARALSIEEHSISIQELSGGNLNKVWRAATQNGTSCIIKHAPPFIASQPDIPLDDSRLTFESIIFKRFQKDDRLAGIQNNHIQVPGFIFYHADQHLLLMEDVGDLPSLLKALNRNAPSADAEKWGQIIGHFIAELHLNTFQNSDYQENFNNRPVQETRFEVQYNRCGDFCRKADVDEQTAKKVEERCRALGKKLISPGYCLIMGDLWPESILVNSHRLVLIDWEMTHYGRPLQDVAHLDAHLWMMADRASSDDLSSLIKRFRRHFIETYFNEIMRNKGFLERMNASKKDYQIHFGAEILARTVGAFKAGYLYESFDTGHPIIQRAVQKAVDEILSF